MNSYSELRARLADDLGLDPGPSVAALYQAMLEQAPGEAAFAAEFARGRRVRPQQASS